MFTSISIRIFAPLFLLSVGRSVYHTGHMYVLLILDTCTYTHTGHVCILLDTRLYTGV